MKKRITIIGADSYVGSSILYKLAKQGHWINAPIKYEHRNRHLKIFHNINVHQCDIFQPKELINTLKKSEVVINCLESYRPRKRCMEAFSLYNNQFCKTLAQACVKNKIKHLIHHSTLALDNLMLINPYWHSKFYGEKAFISSNNLKVSIIQSGWIFGKSISKGHCLVNKIHNKLINKICFPLVAKNFQIAPISIEDISNFFVKIALSTAPISHKKYKIIGPDTITLKVLVEEIAKKLNRKGRIRMFPNFLNSLAVNRGWGCGELFPSLTKDFNISLTAPTINNPQQNIVLGKTGIIEYIDIFINHKPNNEKLSDLRKSS